jgi:hypothetical protein
VRRRGSSACTECPAVLAPTQPAVVVGDHEAVAGLREFQQHLRIGTAVTAADARGADHSDAAAPPPAAPATAPSGSDQQGRASVAGGPRLSRKVLGGTYRPRMSKGAKTVSADRHAGLYFYEGVTVWER